MKPTVYVVVMIPWGAGEACALEAFWDREEAYKFAAAGIRREVWPVPLSG